MAFTFPKIKSPVKPKFDPNLKISAPTGSVPAPEMFPRLTRALGGFGDWLTSQGGFFSTKTAASLGKAATGIGGFFGGPSYTPPSPVISQEPRDDPSTYYNLLQGRVIPTPGKNTPATSFPTIGGQTGPFSPDLLGLTTQKSESPPPPEHEVKKEIDSSISAIPPASSIPAPVSPTTGQQTGAGAPPVTAEPEATAEAKKAQEKAEKAYEESLKISPEELSTQEDVDKLLESVKRGYIATSGQPIALEFITGQLKAAEQRALGLMEPLERRMAKLQAQRLSALESSKFSLERADKKLSELKGEEFTLGEGQSRYDRFGKLIATGPAKTKEPKAPTTIETSQGIMQWDPETGQWEPTGFQKGISEAQSIKAAEKEAEKEEKQEVARQQASLAIGNINSLLAGDRYKAISGAMQTGVIPFLGDRAAVGEYNQLQGILKLGIRQLIKGQGHVSDYEGRILAEAASSLLRTTDEPSFKSALLKARGVLRTNQGLTTEVIVMDPAGNPIGQGMLNGNDIFDAVNDGNNIIYL